MYKDIIVSGMLWQEPGKSDSLGKSSLVSKILCERHNNALSLIDSEAGKAFQNIQLAANHCTKKSLLRKTKYFFINGNLFELWGLKTLFGLYHANIMLKDGEKITGSYKLNSKIAEIGFFGPGILEPLGMNISPNVGVTSRDRLGLSPLLSEKTMSVNGIIIEIRGLSINIILDRQGGNPQYFEKKELYRPTILDISGPERTSRIVFSWDAPMKTVTRVNVTLDYGARTP